MGCARRSARACTLARVDSPDGLEKSGGWRRTAFSFSRADLRGRVRGCNPFLGRPHTPLPLPGRKSSLGVASGFSKKSKNCRRRSPSLFESVRGLFLLPACCCTSSCGAPWCAVLLPSYFDDGCACGDARSLQNDDRHPFSALHAAENAVDEKSSFPAAAACLFVLLLLF